MNQTNCYRHILLCALFSILFIGAQAQSASVKAELETADELYQAQKFADARNTYIKYPQHLSVGQRLALAMSSIVLGRSDAKLMDEGLRSMTKLAEEGMVPAMSTLGILYSSNSLIKKDEAKELYWLEKAAAKNDETACLLLADKYENGKGVTADRQKAKALYYKAEAKGNKKAAYHLGSMALEDGNFSSALANLKNAADGQIPEAMMKLGTIYEEGKGLGRKDLDRAVYWYSRAVDASRDYDFRYQAGLRIDAIGRMEPSTDMSTVKPLLLKLIKGAGNGYNGLLSEQVRPLHRDALDEVFGKPTYYTTTVDLGFKNALVKKIELSGKTYGDLKMKSGTEYSYKADIINSVTEKEASRMFDKWKGLLKQTLRGMNFKEDEESNTKSSYLQMSGYLENGKKVIIKLNLCCSSGIKKQLILEIENG